MYKKEEFKVGDTVAVIANNTISKQQITDDTKTLWKVDGMKFRKSDGVAPGGSMWHISYMRVWDNVTEKQYTEQQQLLKARRVLNRVGLLDPAKVDKKDVNVLASIAEKYSKG